MSIESYKLDHRSRESTLLLDDIIAGRFEAEQAVKLFTAPRMRLSQSGSLSSLLRAVFFQTFGCGIVNIETSKRKLAHPLSLRCPSLVQPVSADAVYANCAPLFVHLLALPPPSHKYFSAAHRDDGKAPTLQPWRRPSAPRSRRSLIKSAN